MSRQSWWKGIILFPLVWVGMLVSRYAIGFFVRSTTKNNPNIGTTLASWALSLIASWTGIIAGIVVLISLLADIRALRQDEPWTPTYAWALAGIVHLAGIVVRELFLVSIPVLSYYLYKRRVQVGTP